MSPTESVFRRQRPRFRPSLSKTSSSLHSLQLGLNLGSFSFKDCFSVFGLILTLIKVGKGGYESKVKKTVGFLRL
jgi:hypothetical protein